MMGRLKSDQAQLLYEFHLRDAVPEDHLVRKILAHNLAGKLTGDQGRKATIMAVP
jgi:hypothetical protein